MKKEDFNMNVYITFDRYERNEWFYVYRIETNKQRAIKHFKETDLLSFLEYGPDDCHSFQLMKVVMSKKDYERLCYMVENEGNDEINCDKELEKMLISIYEENENDRFSCYEILYSTDGCSDNVEIIDFYMVNYDYDIRDGEDEDSVRDRITDMIYNDSELYNNIMREYIKENY